MLEIGKIYRTESGLGGTFDVELLSLADDRAAVRVHEPRNPDWNGYHFTTRPDALRPIPRVWQVRTRVGKTTGAADDFLSWGRFPSKAEADAAAEAARAYPKCHPVQIVEIDA